MEETTLDETESVSTKRTKSRRSSILKQRTPLQVIEPNPRRVSFAFKQTKEFHSTEAPFVLGSSYEETFQSDSPKCTQDSHFTMKMVHSATTVETYTDRSIDPNMVSWHEELFNTTQLVNIDNLGNSESEYEARMCIDIDDQHCGLGIEEITHKNEKRRLNWNEQNENENLSPEILDHLMKKPRTQASKQVPYQHGNKNHLDHEMGKAVNNPKYEANNSKANIWEHHSSQTFIECSFPSDHIARNESLWNNDLMPYLLNRKESKEFSRSASTRSGNEFTEVTQPAEDTVHINKDKLLMNADMDFTDVININKTNSGSHTSHVNNDMDLTNGIFCRGATSNSDGAQGFADLDESEIEFTNTVGHIAVSESEDTFNKISGNVLDCDPGSLSDSSKIKKAGTKCMYKINAHHLQPSIALEQNTLEMTSGVDNYICTVAHESFKEKKYILEESHGCNQAVSKDAAKLKPTTNVFQMNLCEKKKEDINDSALKFIHHTKFVDATDCRPREEISRTNKVNENNSKSTNISKAVHIELTNPSWQKLVTEISQSSQMESIDVRGFNSAVEISDDSQLEFTGVIRCKSPAKNIDDSLPGVTNATMCKQIEKLADNIFNNTEINNDSADDSQLEITDVIRSKSFAKNSNNYMELTDVAGYKIPLKITDDNDQELTEVGGYKEVDTSFNDINIEPTNINSDKLNCNNKVECHNTYNTENTGLQPVPGVSDYRQMDYAKLVSYKPLTEVLHGVQRELRNVNCMPTLECDEDCQLEFTSIAACKPNAETANIPITEDRPYHVSEQSEENQLKLIGFKSLDSTLEFTNIVKDELPVGNSNDSQLDFTNIVGQKPLAKDTEFSQLEITGVMQKLNSVASNGSQLEFTNSIVQKLPVKDFENSQMELTNNTRQKFLAKDSDDSQLELKNITRHRLPEDSQLEFTNNTKQILFAKDSDYNLLEFTDIVTHNLAAEDTDINQLEFTNITGEKLQLTNMSMQKLPVSSSDGSQLELTNTTSLQLPTNDSGSSPMEFTNITRQKLPAKDSDDNEEFTNNSRQNLPAKESDDSQLEFKSIPRHGLPERYSDNPLEITKITKTCAKYSDVSQLDFTNTDGYIPSLKNSVDVDLEFTACRYVTDVSDCSKELEAVHFGHTNDCKLKLSNELQMKTATLNEKEGEGNFDQTDSQIALLSAIRLGTASEICDKSCVSVRETVDSENDPNMECIGVVGINTDVSGKVLSHKKTHMCSGSINLDSSQLEHSDITLPTANISRNLSCSKITEAIDDSQLELANMVGIKTVAESCGSKTEIIDIQSVKALEKDDHIESTVIMDITNGIQFRKNPESQMELTDIGNRPEYSIKCIHEEREESVNKSVDVIELGSNVSAQHMFPNKKRNANDDFTASIKYVNDVPMDSLLQKNPQLQSPIKEMFLDSNVQQSSVTVNQYPDDFMDAKDVIEQMVAPKTEELVRNDAYRAKDHHLTYNNKQKRALKKIQAAQNYLNITLGSDETFMFESLTNTFTDTVNKKLQMSKRLKHFDNTYSSPSSAERLRLDTDSGSATNSIIEEVKENQKQNIEHVQTKDINLHCEPGHTLLVENELVILVDEPGYNFESEDEACDNLIKSILNADRSLFSSLSTASPATELSSYVDSPTVTNSKECLVEEIHPNLEQNKESMHCTKPEMMTERSFADEQLPNVHVLKQSSVKNDTKMELCHVSADANLPSVAGKDVSAVEEAEVLTCSSFNREEILKKVVDIDVSGRGKETDQLLNIALVPMKLNCEKLVEQVKNKTECIEAAAVLDVGQACVPVIQKPLSLEEWLRSRKSEWDVKELSDTQWRFEFLYKSLGLILKLDGSKCISDIFLESYLTKNSAPETHFVHHILLKKLSPQNLKAKFKVTSDVPKLMNIISKAVAEMKLFIKDFIFMETCKLMNMKDNRVSFKMSDMHIHAVFCITVDLSNWESIKPENVAVDDIMGTINKKEVQSLVNAVPKGPTFLSEYVNIVREYISVLRKK